MRFAALGLQAVVQIAFWGALLLFGVWAYRRLRLPSLPWLAAYVLLGFVISFFPPYFTRRIIEGHPGPGILLAALGVSPETFFSEIWPGVGGSIRTLSKAIVAWFLVAEFAFVLSRSSFAESLTVPKMALVPRNHVTTFGIALLGSRLMFPLVLLLVWVV